MKTTDSTTRSSLNLWNEIVPVMDRLLGMKTHIVYPGGKDPYYQWFVDLESDAFRSELRYSADELEERLSNNDLLFLFVLSPQGREAVILAYEDPDNPNHAFYLDTIAVKKPGHGLGSLLLKTLINYARSKSYGLIRLDTEYVNEKGQELVKFYEGLGFHPTETTDDGNVSMELEI